MSNGKKLVFEWAFIPLKRLHEIKLHESSFEQVFVEEQKLGRYTESLDRVDYVRGFIGVDIYANVDFYHPQKNVFLKVELYNLNGTKFSYINDHLSICFVGTEKFDRSVVFDNFSRLARPAFSGFKDVKVHVALEKSIDDIEMNFLDFLNKADLEAINKISITKKILKDQDFIKEIYLDEQSNIIEGIQLFESFSYSFDFWKESYELPDDYPVPKEVSDMYRDDDFCVFPLNTPISVEVRLFNESVLTLEILYLFPTDKGFSFLAFKKNEKKKRIYFSREITDFYFVDKKKLEELERKHKSWKLGSYSLINNTKEKKKIILVSILLIIIVAVILIAFYFYNDNKNKKSRIKKKKI